MDLKYQRVLLKLSGEALLGCRQWGIDPETLDWVANEIAGAHSLGVEIAVVVGGGNIYRGSDASKLGIDRSSADYIGMLATVMNSLALKAVLESKGLAARVMTAIKMESVAEPYITSRAQMHLEKGRLLILACGTGSPYFTTDTAGALRALELKANVLLKATDVEGVFTADPAVNPRATRYERLGYRDYLSSGLSVMDWTAVSLCWANDLPIVVFNLLEKDNLRRVLSGEKVGTVLAEVKDA